MRRNKQEMMEMYEKICGLRRQGKSRKEICREYECSISTVDRAIRMCGEKEIKRDSFEDHKEQILSMYSEGATLEEIAESTGMSASAINRRLLKMGKRRRRGWHPEGSMKRQVGHREREEALPEAKQYAPAEVKQVREIRVKVRGRWKTMQDVSEWWL